MSLAITWRLLQINYNDEIEVVTIEDLSPVYTLSPLLTDTVYNISVSATNSAGEGNYSNIITTSTLSEGVLNYLYVSMYLPLSYVHIN